VNDFDDEPGTGGGYERVIRITLYDPDGIPRRIVLRMRGLGRQMRAAVTLEEQRGDILGQVVRFDDAHGRFHRHQPSWPEPGPIVEFLDHVETRRRAAYAREQIQMRYPHWDAELFGKESDDHHDS
jgi:hypothetical protein